MADTIEVEGEIHHTTPEAILFSTTGDEDDAKWLPLSRVEVDDSQPVAVLTLPERLAIDKGLI